jgi:hypothetical protein
MACSGCCSGRIFLVLPAEPESKGEESDFRWTQEPDGLKSPIQNKSESVRFLAALQGSKLNPLSNYGG